MLEHGPKIETGTREGCDRLAGDGRIQHTAVTGTFDPAILNKIGEFLHDSEIFLVCEISYHDIR